MSTVSKSKCKNGYRINNRIINPLVGDVQLRNISHSKIAKKQKLSKSCPSQTFIWLFFCLHKWFILLGLTSVYLLKANINPVYFSLLTVFLHLILHNFSFWRGYQLSAKPKVVFSFEKMAGDDFIQIAPTNWRRQQTTHLSPITYLYSFNMYNFIKQAIKKSISNNIILS